MSFDDPAEKGTSNPVPGMLRRFASEEFRRVLMMNRISFRDDRPHAGSGSVARRMALSGSLVTMLCAAGCQPDSHPASQSAESSIAELRSASPTDLAVTPPEPETKPEPKPERKVTAEPVLNGAFGVRDWKSFETFLSDNPDRDDLRYVLIDGLVGLGYRHRACHHIDALIARGTARLDDLVVASDRRGIYDDGVAEDDPSQETAADAIDRPLDSRPLAMAQDCLRRRDYQAGMTVLENSSRRDGKWNHPESAALYGRLMVGSQDYNGVASWLSECPESVTGYAHYWTSVGMVLRDTGQFQLAASAFLQAIEIDATSSLDYRMLGGCIAEMGEPDLALEIYNRGKLVDGIKSLAGKLIAKPDADFLLKPMAERLVELGRPLEALQWQTVFLTDRLAKAVGDEPADIQGKLKASSDQRSGLISRPDYASSMRQYARFGLMENFFPAPDRSAIRRVLAESKNLLDPSPSLDDLPPSTSSVPIVMHDITSETGMAFQYFNRTPLTLRQIRLHETLGGGIGVIDYDLDGHQDFFFAQASGDPPSVAGDLPDALFRTVGRKLIDVAKQAMVADVDYSLGVAIGDVNQDGWPDIFVGNLGTNRLLINQGDGTFADASRTFDRSEPRFTASVAIADVDADGLPDLVEANYTDDEKIFLPLPPPVDGIPAAAAPGDFLAGTNRWWHNQGADLASADQAFTPDDLEFPLQPVPQSSLGLVVTDILSNSPGNEIFVGNDMRANRLWARSDIKGPFTNRATAAGVGLDSTGTATASMGIAVGDFDGNEELDLHVTNFRNESSSLFMQSSGGLFSDLSAKFNIDRPTFSMVGFGTQAFDVNLDGRLDMAIMNGHIEDMSSIGRGYKMPPQVMLNTGRKGFDTTNVEDPSGSEAGGFWDRPTLGRSLVTVDWNNDGRMDLVANHLDVPASLLENQTRSDGDWLSLKIVGVSSDRDAVGAKVTVTASGQADAAKIIRWQTGADGYLCRNDSRLHFGLGSQVPIVDVTIDWPSGTRQTISGVKTSREYIVVENESAWDARP